MDQKPVKLDYETPSPPEPGRNWALWAVNAGLIAVILGILFYRYLIARVYAT